MRNLSWLGTCSALALTLVASGCGSSGGNEEASNTPTTDGGAGTGGAGGAGNGGGANHGGSGGSTISPEGGTCPGGCDGGVCVQGSCCETARVCGNACCASGDVCSFEKCETPGKTCLDGADCPEDSYCEYALGDNEADGGVPDAGTCHGGVSLKTGKCLPKPPECPDGVQPDPNKPITCLAACEYKPPNTSFAAVEKASWKKGDIMMAPIVVQLDDDNCDNKVNERDIPEIVFSTFAGGDYHKNGTLWAVSLMDGKFVEKWHVTPTTDSIHPGVSIAGGDIDGKPGNEIVVCTSTGKVRAYHGDGKPMWTSEVAGCSMPSIGDLNQDGVPEVVVNGAVLAGDNGATIAKLVPRPANIVLSDMDGDGKLDIVGPKAVYHVDGSVVASTDKIDGNLVAVGDFDKDGVPEVATIQYGAHLLHVWHLNPSDSSKIVILRKNIDINGKNPNVCPTGSAGNTRGGGPPTIADFNGDGTPDVAVAGGIGYVVLDGTKILDPKVAADNALLWIQKTHDCSSAATGSSLFDFNGDGKAEVVYSDEQFMRVYDGKDGKELFKTCNTTGTLVEYPLVADVDADGEADIVVVANAYSSITCPTDSSKQRGLRVFGSPDGTWVRTRRIWNQHAYHVTNVNEDGTIPKVEKPNWKQPRLNNFRQNVQPGSEFNAPDLVVTLAPVCPAGQYRLVATVRNVGTASVAPPVVVGFYQGDPSAGGKLLGQGSTTKDLYPAESENILLPLDPVPNDLLTGKTPAYAVVDDGSPSHSWHECRTDNNTAGPVSGVCSSGPK